ncbi:hypothetical protein ABDJ41_14080 [Pedobacter sp. ASV1-7]|uniref:hypothetical protein n=1 Tax=Pedobacter sp. ASV1-7 TaxID=3145237 RepID=UPI0032E8F766
MKKELFIVTLLFYSCSLFRKTSKTKDIVTQSSKNQLDFSQLVLKSSGKETRVFTYWNDSGFYQYQHIKEQLDQAKSDQLKTITQHAAGQTIATKNTTSLQTWGIVGMFMLTLVFGFLYRRCRS